MLVMALHTQCGPSEAAPCNNIVFYAAARCAMPIFFMVNGTLIMRKNEFNFAYYKRKMLNIIRVLIMWGCIVAVYYMLYRHAGIAYSLKEGFKASLAYHWVVNLWFLITFGLIYTILLFSFSKIKKYIKQITIILGIICISVDAVSLISIQNGGFFIQDHISQRLRLWTWMFYFLAGYLIDKIDVKKIKKHLIYVPAVILTISCVLLQINICNKTNQYELNYIYDNILVIFWIFFVFLTVKISPAFSNMLARFSKPAFGAFLMHSLIIDAAYLRGIVNGPFESFISWALLVTGTWTLSWIAGKIPVVKELFRY